MARRFCTGCGNPLRESAQFCGNCGSPQTPGEHGTGTAPPPVIEPSHGRPPPPTAKTKLPVKTAAVIVIILLIAGAGAFFVLPKIGIRLFPSSHAPPAGTTAGSLPANLDATKVYSFGAVRDSGNGYTMTMDPVPVNKDVTLEKTMTYEKQPDGRYAGALTLHFTGTGSSGTMQYQEIIPKSFASDVKSLTFSVPPDRIIQSDPVVAWNKNIQGSMDIKVTSSEVKTKDDAKVTAEEALINGSMNECQKLADDRNRLACALEVVRKYRNTKTGQDLSDMDFTQGIDATIAAVVTKNPDRYCEKISNEQDRLACRKDAFMMYVRDCNEGPADARSDCIRKNLWQINNYHTIIGACEYITDPALKAECTGRVDAGYCGKIADPALRNKCLVHSAHTKADVSLCSGVTDTNLRDLCTEQVSLSKNDEKVCSGIRDADQRDHCIASIASTKGDIRICNAVTDPQMKAACINAAGFTATMSDKGDNFKDLSICNTDTMKGSPENRDLCIIMVAGRNVDPDICEQVVDETSRDTCFFAFSLTADSSVCTRIADEYMRDNCIKVIAEGTKDPGLCDDIQIEELGDECRNNTKHGVAAITLFTPEQMARANTARGAGPNPAGSICTSPAFKLASKFVAGHGDAGSGSGGLDPDHCYQAIAVNLGDTSMCSNIRRGAPMTKCYLLIAGKQNAPGICDEIPSTPDPQAYLKIDCLWEVAQQNHNAGACEAMGNENISRMFIGEISRQTCLRRIGSGPAGSGGSGP